MKRTKHMKHVKRTEHCMNGTRRDAPHTASGADLSTSE